MPKFVVIVESPAKAKTIGKFLGRDYRVTSCMGHVRDLPKKTFGVDVEDGFKPHYQVLKSRQKVLTSLRKAVKDAEAVYLATDPDREGEAIAWHLAKALRLPGSRIRRVTFNEITRAAVRRAFEGPRAINMDVVNAQQARRILDRIVGYQLSPLLWKKVARGLSAGRVQSVALRLIVEREREIGAFVAEEYWKITARLRPTREGEAAAPAQAEDEAEKSVFEAELARVDGEKSKITDEEGSKTLLERLDPARNAYRVGSVQTKRTQVRPGPPFATSQLQQAASVRLGFRPKRTMFVAQQLYEGIEVGAEGSVGLITYMRTDSFRVADEALRECRAFIPRQFGPDYLSAQPRHYKARKSAQEAHEAIRPTSVERTPEALAPHLTREQLKLYRLIWERFVASQMAEAQYDVTRVKVDVLAQGAAWAEFRATGRVQIFDGHTRVYGALRRPEDEPQPLPPLADGLPLDCLGLAPSQHFTKAPARYTEASLVKTLEKEGIGRPSTYAQIISTIQDRGYTEVKAKAFYAKELGMVTNDALLPFFGNIINTEFTSHLEQELDDIEEAKFDWQEALREFHKPFQADLEKAQAEMPSVKKELAEETDEICEKCGAPMIMKLSRRGRFLACSAYPKCRNTRPVGEDGKPVPLETLDQTCPECGDGTLVVRTGRRGKFVGCSRYPECNYTRELTPTEGGSAQEKPKRPPPEPIGENCPLCGQPLMARTGRRGKFIGCSAYPKCRYTRDPAGEAPPQGETTDEVCEKCGKPMAIKSGRRGRFLGCSGYPKCKNTKPFHAPGPAEPPEEIGRDCPECGKPLVVRTGRRGKFIGCSTYPKCRHTENVDAPPEDGPQADKQD